MTEERPKIAVASEQDVAEYAGKVDGGAPTSDSPPPADTVAALERQRDEFKDRMLRAQAECANISKRLQQQHAESLKLAGMGLVRAILPALDNFDRTLANLKEAHAEDPVIAGVKMIADQLAKALKDYGVEPIAAVGRPFDPTLHEALLHDRQSNQAAGIVTQEFERGYMLHDRVVRHAKVAVAAEPAEAESGDGSP